MFSFDRIVRYADDFLKPDTSEAGSIGVGRADGVADNTGGADGEMTALYSPGMFRFAHSDGADEIDQCQTGEVCFVVDDQTVAATDDGSARSRAGIVDGIEGSAVWVRLDEALTRAS